MMDIRDEILELVKQESPDNPLQYVHDIVREYAHSKLNGHILNCQDCPICNGPKSLAIGNSNASILIIGESAPGDEYPEAQSISPFGDKEQEILDKVFELLHVNTNEIFYINAVNCWSHKQDGNGKVKRTPHKKEVENCSLFVDYAIKLVQPLVIILLGGIALNLFYKEAISTARGNWIEVRGIPAMPTYHPGYFLKIEGKKDSDIIEMQKWDFYNDIKKAFQYIQETYPDNGVLLEPITE